MCSTSNTLLSVYQITNKKKDPCKRRPAWNWHACETGEGLHFCMDMPGLGKEDVKVSVEQNTLVVQGQGKKEDNVAVGARQYSSRVNLPEKHYKLSEIRACMKNGALEVFVPYVKDERPDVFQVNVD